LNQNNNTNNTNNATTNSNTAKSKASEVKGETESAGENQASPSVEILEEPADEGARARGVR
jgi:hypothetical protein